MTHLLVLLLAAWMAPQPAQTTPRDAVDELLAADRGFSAAGAKLDVIASISAMFADDMAIMPVPPDGFARGKAKAIEALAGNPDNAKSRVEWTPIRAGISADGQHGFTFGYMTLLRPDGTRAPLKYLSYWVRQAAGWRVVVYKRSRGAEVGGPHDLIPAALPAQLVVPTTDPAVIARHRDSLDRAERAFSDEAQTNRHRPRIRKARERRRRESGSLDGVTRHRRRRGDRARHWRRRAAEREPRLMGTRSGRRRFER